MVLSTLLILSLLIGAAAFPQSTLAGNAADVTVKAGYPTHYFVFKHQADGTIVADSYQIVKMSAPMRSLTQEQVTLALAQPGRNMEWLVVLLQDAQGKVIFRDVVSYSSWLRGEFHSDTPGQEIDGHLIPVKSSAFVVRLPMEGAEKLILQDSHLTTLAEFNLDETIAQSSGTQGETIQFAAEQQNVTGSPANRVDLVILGDGYTAEQGNQFLSDSAAIAEQFFSISPLSEYSNYYNLYMLMAASNESGSDHPPYSASCGYEDPTCCGDPAMQSDPLQGQMVDTAFDSRFCGYWIHRLLVADEGKVMEAAGAVPDWDQILLIVNDTTYGGSGGSSLAVISMNSQAVQIGQHEFGHSFVNLADEYSSPYPGYPPCSDVPGSDNLCESNVTDVTSRDEIKWSPWILEDTLIPTPNNPSYDGLVGLFEGARYQTTGMYRSGYSCIMRALGEPFCQVPSQSYVLRLYQGGWGLPFDGISLIEPDSTLPISTTISLIHPSEQSFSADLLSPVGGPALTVTWLDNGIPIPGVVSDTFTYTTRADSPGIHEISLQVKDATLLVNPLMDEGELEQDYTWLVEVSVPLTVTVNASPDTIFADGTSTATITASVMSGDQPLVGEVMTFTTSLGEVSPITATTDISGTATTVLTSGMVTGTATVSIAVGGNSMSVEVEFVALPRVFLPLIRRP